MLVPDEDVVVEHACGRDAVGRWVGRVTLRCRQLGFERAIGHGAAARRAALEALDDVAFAALREGDYALPEPRMTAVRALLTADDRALIAGLFPGDPVLREVARREAAARGLLDGELSGLYAIGRHGPAAAEQQAVELLLAQL